MQKPVINTSDEFIFAKLHGMWANAAKDARLAQLANAGSVDEIIRLLAEYKLDASRRELFHRNLLQREIESLSAISAQLDKRTAEFYRAFIERAYFDNLKALLHDKFSGRAAAIRPMTAAIPGLPEIPAAELLGQDSAESFLQVLNPALFPEEIGAIVRKLFDDNNIMSMECELDKLAYHHLLTHAENVPMNVRSACKALVKMEIDIVNLRMLMRVVRTYRLDETTAAAIWIDGGTVPPALLTTLSGLKTLADVVAKLPTAFRDALQPFTAADLYVSENTLWKLLYKQTKKYFSDYDHMELSIVAFPFLRHFETLNIGRIYEGIRFGMRPQDVQEMLICS